ncbi:hypothetical protein NHQ30_007074 [Ciborinia camelliae]|nr:hypothetical protein NHQ30_007074 [Ciborinia camelliae]
MHLLGLSSSVLLLFAISSSLLSVAESSTAACFFPDKSVANNFVPCSPTQNGGCSSNSSIVNVIACNVADSDGTWCCAYDGNCCSGSSTFIAGFGTMFAEPGNPLGSSSAVSASISVPASTTTSASSTTSQTSLISATASTSSPSTTTTPIPSTNSTSSIPAVVGAAVGVPLGLAVIAALFLFYRERRKRTNPEASGFGMKKLDDGASASAGGTPGSPAAGCHALSQQMNRYEEMGIRDPHYELGPGAKPVELGDR